MEAIKQIFRVNKNHEIMVKIPSHIQENELIEMIMIVKNNPDRFNQKLEKMKLAINDKLFQDDLKGIAEDFEIIDRQGWE